MSSKHVGPAARIGVVVALIAAFGPVVGAQRPERWVASEAPRFFTDDPVWVDDDMRDIPPVARVELSQTYEFVAESFRGTAKSFGPALNTNTLDEVPDSSWFTNRIGRRDMTLEEMMAGPNRVDGPAPGPWLVTGRPGSGITPKFTIKDARGDTYLIKLDPAEFPELPSSVEVIATKIFHAIGYHVPEDSIVTFSPSQLSVAATATMRTPQGKKKPLLMADVEAWLRATPKAADGRIRALASRYVPGKVVGQFRYSGTRADDPNDIYPHERRRELRGMRVFAAWLHHDDARSLNSIDAYVEEGGRRHLRHYVQDFGSTLGSGSTSAQQPRAGYEYLVEPDKIGKGLISLGLWRRDWTRARYETHPALGVVEADFFEPWKWKTEYPQPAFDQMDAADAFWAARIASRFSDEMIRAIVKTGQLSDPEAERVLGDIIIRRRDKVVAYWIGQTNPIDVLGVEQNDAGTVLSFDNVAVQLGLVQRAGHYRVQWSSLDNAAQVQQPVGEAMETVVGRVAVPAEAWGPIEAGRRYAVVEIATMHPDRPEWAAPVVVTLREYDGMVDVVGIRRPTDVASGLSRTSR
jgi:hypothetical protein